ncbi:MAG: divergent polysaccharide deacetylase family protein [Deltaproteobacteria bacterium]|nr:divergent polysaccharide deacetylase family protein [Deltaproteobacteria bacterium]
MARKKKGGLTLWAVLAVGFMAGAAVVLILVKYSDLFTPAPAPRVEKPPVQKPFVPEVTAPEVPSAVAPPVKKAYPRVAIVIDDMGQDMKKLRELIALNAPITVAVLPNLSHSKDTAKEAHARGLEVLLHLPMEPKDLGDNNPGKGALLTAMTSEEIRKNIEDDLKTVPYAAGVNNHMGSRFTEDERQMRSVLNVVKKRKMFFLDSRTSSNSVAGKVAGEIGVRNADRNVFLDNSRDITYIKGQITELVSIARKHGSAIAIGHPHPETIEAIKESLEVLNGSVEIVKLSDIVNKKETEQP